MNRYSLLVALCALSCSDSEPTAIDPPAVPDEREEVVLDSLPHGASIEVDGVALGLLTPATLHLTPGTHIYTLRLIGYCDFNGTLVVARGHNPVTIVLLGRKNPHPPVGSFINRYSFFVL